ncbi:MAG: hypothetical protein KF857_12360 [Fimbriimonadaceae bacterium]|nr:hypothetical protein [Fimbriimonadaceae bacterium]
MTRFAFIVHPISPKDIARKVPPAKLMPDGAIEALLRTMKPSVASHITGVRSLTGATTEGVFIGLPLTPKMFLSDPLESVYDKIHACCEIAEQEGCDLIGLGAFTSVVGDGGVTVAERTKIAVTTGNSYTVATALEGTLDACSRVGLDTSGATLAVVGATGAIGRTCALCLAPSFAKTILIGRDQARTEAVAGQVVRGEATTDVRRVREADVIVTVTSSDTAVIQPEDLKAGSVVCDVARPRDVSVRVAKERPDVLVIEGGVVAVPGDVDFGMDFGFPPKTAYACMSETMMLALDGRAESFTLGKDVSVEQVQETRRLADKHGFKLAGYRSFEKAVGPEAIDRVRAARLASV